MEIQRGPDDKILTIHQVARILQCSKAHVCNALHGKVEGLPPLPHFSLGRRKLVRQRWLDEWIESHRSQC